MATLNFNDWIVGPNTVPMKEFYPGSRTTRLVTFAGDITGYTFETEYRVFVADTIAFDRSGDPNFSESTVIGQFESAVVTGSDVPVIVSASPGTVNLFYPADMYTGALYSSSRTKPVIAVVTLKYTDADDNIDFMRFPLLVSYQPSIEFGDPTAEVGYTAI